MQQVPRRIPAGASMRWTSCSRAIASSSIARRTSASSRKEQAIAYGLTGPNLRGSGVDHDLRKTHPYLGYEQYEFDVPIGSRRRLLRSLPRAHGGDAAERAHPAPGARRSCPTGRSTCTIRRIIPPPKTTVLTKMEELIHHFIIHTEGHRRAGRRSLFRRGKSEGRTRLLHQLAKAAARRTG